MHNRSATIALAEMMHGENALTGGRAPVIRQRDPLLSLRNHLRQRGDAPTRSRTASSLTDDRSLRVRHALRERSAMTGSYFGFAASAFVASEPDFGTNCPCTRPDLALVSTVA